MIDEHTSETEEAKAGTSAVTTYVTPEQIAEIADSGRVLQQVISQDPSVMSDVEMILREHLRKGLTTYTMQAILQGLRMYLANDLVTFVWSVVTKTDRDEDLAYVEQVKNQLPAQIWHWLRRLTAVYGRDLQEAYAIGGENPDGWKTVNRRAFFDTLSGRWGISLDIIKYNGEHLLLDDDVQPALVLAYGIVDTLNMIPAESAPSLVSAEPMKLAAAIFKRFFELYAPGAYEGPDEIPQTPPETASCSRCSKEIRPGAKFCPWCGYVLNA